MKLLVLLQNERKYFLLMAGLSGVLFIAMMVQSYIRYGHHATYNPWVSLQYLSVVYPLFLLGLPFFVYQIIKWRSRLDLGFSLQVGLLSLLVLVINYLAGSIIFHLLGFFEGESWVSATYASYYFGREALFHVLILGSTAVYVKKRSNGALLVSGTLGRRKVEVRSQMIQWIEADDHYLRVHTVQYDFLKRGTLEQMARELAPDFVRVHRKYLVNRKKIIGTEKVQRDRFVVLASGEKIKIGRSYSSVTLD